MAKWKDREDEYHKQFAERIIEALKAGTAPWQKPWQPGERVLPHNFASGRDYRGGNAVYLAVQGLDRGYTDPRWGGYRQIEKAGGHVRKGEKGTPIMYVEFYRRVQVRDQRGKPVLDGEGRPTYTREKRDRPLTKIQHVFNVEQTEGLKLRPLARAAPEWEGHQRVEAVMQNSGVRINHRAGDRAYYNQTEDRVVLPVRSQFPTQDAYSHTALHELGHATGHEKRLNRVTLTHHGGFGSETYAREELRAEISAMMAGEKLGVGHEPRHGHAYVASWVKALENDPREIRAACVDAQKMSDWLVARERERVVEKEQPAQEQPAVAETRAPAAPERTAPARKAEQPDRAAEQPAVPLAASASTPPGRTPGPAQGTDRTRGREVERDTAPSR